MAGSSTVEIVIMHMVKMHNFENASGLGGNAARSLWFVIEIA